MPGGRRSPGALVPAGFIILLAIYAPGAHAAGPPPARSAGGPPVLVMVKGVSAFQDTRDGFLSRAPGTRVVELEPDLSNARTLLEPIRDLNPAVVVAIGSPAAMATQEYLPAFPKVFGLILQPKHFLGDRAVKSGFTLVIDPDSRMEALGRLFRPLKKIAVLEGPEGSDEARLLGAAARARQAELQVLPARRAEDIGNSLRSLTRDTQALITTTEPLFLKEEVARALIRKAMEVGVPVVGFTEKAVRAGGLAALEIDYRAHGAGLAQAAARAGAAGAAEGAAFAPAREYRWVVNTNTARTLGISIPAEILEDAGGAGRVEMAP